MSARLHPLSCCAELRAPQRCSLAAVGRSSQPGVSCSLMQRSMRQRSHRGRAQRPSLHARRQRQLCCASSASQDTDEVKAVA